MSETDTPDLEALAERLDDERDLVKDGGLMGFALDVHEAQGIANTMTNAANALRWAAAEIEHPALAARVIELEAENTRLREALERVVEITEDNKLDQTAALVAALNVAQDGLSGRDAYAEYVAALETRHD